MKPTKAWVVVNPEWMPISVAVVKLNAIRRAVELFGGKFHYFDDMKSIGYRCVQVTIIENKEGK